MRTNEEDTEKRFDSGYLDAACHIRYREMAFHLAYIERGYEAVGGEYLLILAVYWGAWKAINYLFDSLEELEDERNCRKKRSRGTARMRNYR